MSGTEYWARQVRAACEAVDIEVEILERPAADEIHVRPGNPPTTTRAAVASALERHGIGVSYGPDATTVCVETSQSRLETSPASGVSP